MVFNSPPIPGSDSLFHYQGAWYAYRNSCLHRGGPIATGALRQDILVCPWHGFEYCLTDGHLLADPNVVLESFPVVLREG